MAAAGVSLLLLFLLQLVFTEGVTCNNRFLVTATNQTNGVEIRIVYSEKDYAQREINGHFLSPECGENYHGCSQPLVLNTSAALAKREQSFVVILPLEKALGLMQFSVGLSEEPHIIDLSEQKYNCSPTSVYHIRNSYYIVCPNAASNYIKLLELRLNTTHLEESYLPVLEHPHLESVRSLTNSLYVDLPSESGPVIFFATGYEVFYFRPLQYVIEELDIGLQEKECFAKSIEYIGDWEMLIYCDNDQAMYVDMNREFIFTSVEYAKDGRPYICPNPDVYLAIYAKAHYILYAFRSTKQASNFELPGRNFDNGICLGSQNVTLFAFSDRERGTQLLNTSATGSIRSLSGTTCTNYPCQPLVILQDRYLVIREKREGSWFISILDSSKDFSLVLEAQHSNADLMTLIDNVHVCAQAAIGALDSSDSPTHIPVNIVISVTVVSVSFLVVLIVSGVLFRCIRKKPSTSTIVHHEQRHTMSESMVPGTYGKEAGGLQGTQMDGVRCLGAESVAAVFPSTESDASKGPVSIPLGIMNNGSGAAAVGDQLKRTPVKETRLSQDSNSESHPLLSSGSTESPEEAC